MLRFSKFLLLAALVLPVAFSQQSYPFFSPSPAAPLLVTATANSPFGQSSYCYWVVVVYPIGKSTPSAPSCLSNAIETSSVLISWSAAQGASSYDVLRTTTPILPNVTSSIAVATAVSGTTQTDSFGALSSYTITSAVPATANLYLDNTAFSTPQLRAIVTGVGGTSAFNLGSGGGGTPGGSSGQVQYNNSGAFGGFTVSGDATLNTGTGVLTVGNGAITNAKLANSLTTVNGQTCTLGSTCNANAGAAAHSVALNEGSGAAFAAATIGTSGRLLIDQGAAADPSFNAVSGDGTITSGGVLTVTQVNGATVPTSAKLISTNGSKQLVAASAETAPITVSATGGIACATCATTSSGGALSGTAPITLSAGGAVGINFTANLQNSGGSLDTIQGIQTTSDPQFASLGLGQAAAGGTANGFLYQSSGVTNTANQIAGGTLSAGNTTITCTSTTGFPSSGIAWIKDGATSELITYTGTTGTTLTGATRGAYATTAASHTTSAYVLPVTAMFSRSSSATPSMFIAHWGSASGPIVIVGSGGDDNGIPASSVPTLVATPGRLSGDTIQATNLFTSTGTVFYRGGGTVINVGDDKAYTININSSTGTTAFNGTGAITMNGLVSKYNNISTAGIGLVANYASVASTGQTASIGTTNLQCGGAVCAAGKYRVTVYDVVTATGTGTLTSTIAYNDGTAARTQTSSGVSTTATNFEQVSYVLRADGVNNITYATTLSVSGTYSIYVDLERLQ